MTTRTQRPSHTAPTPTRFNDRKLAPVNPAKEQFEPTPQAPVRQRYKMAGGA